ncbi:hypothetical protein [Variovorax sp. N23]|nr:hypothetical protein [Variovorax sp. N23]MCU4119001.1 hypothetical protein [Variovorax sp. N23]
MRHRTVSLSRPENGVAQEGRRIAADPQFKARQPLSAHAVDALRDGSLND